MVESQALERILQHARELGFPVGAVAAITRGADEAFFGDWLDRGYGADMDWLARRRGERVDPTGLLPGAKSLLCLAMPYRPKKEPGSVPALSGQVSRYAWGRDYHQLVGKRLKKLRRFIEGVLPGAKTYVNVDTGPVLERSWAERAGLGWIGHNTCLIDPKRGSYLFLAEVLIDRELPPLPPVHEVMPDCGTCRACLDACPTGALVDKGVLDSRRCISYLTIENRGPIPAELREQMGDWVFGCDICQEVCPWNAEAARSVEPDFEARPGHARLDLAALLRASDEEIEERFLGSPLRRARGRGLKRNALVALGNSGDPKARAILEAFLETTHDTLLAEHTRWARERLREERKGREG